MKRREIWRAILDARTDVDRLVASAVGDYPNRAPLRPSGPATQAPFLAATWQDPGATAGGITQVTAAGAGAGAGQGSRATVTDDERRALSDLNVRVQARITALDEGLGDERGRADVIKALVLYFDERIMGRLPDYLSPSWPLLQTAYTGSTTGGDDFYRFVEELRQKPNTPSLVFEVYYFCLENGFVGRYANDLGSIERYQQWIREAIELPRAPTDSADTTEVSVGTSKPVSAWVIYTGALAVVLVITAVQVALSNYYEETELEDWAAHLMKPDSKLCKDPT